MCVYTVILPIFSHSFGMFVMTFKDILIPQHLIDLGYNESTAGLMYALDSWIIVISVFFFMYVKVSDGCQVSSLLISFLTTILALFSRTNLLDSGLGVSNFYGSWDAFEWISL